jgi:hypothetical protein
MPFEEVKRLLCMHLQSWHRGGMLTDNKHVYDCLQDLFRSELICTVPQTLAAQLRASNADIDQLCVVVVEDVMQPIYYDADSSSASLGWYIHTLHCTKTR